MNILLVSGSLRTDSWNTQLLHAVKAFFPGDVHLTFVDGLDHLPGYNDDWQSSGVRPQEVQRFWTALADADGVLFSTPEYNSSIPGFLKNSLDWMSRPLDESPLRNKPVAVIGASTGMFGAVWAQAELRKVLAAIGARVVGDSEVPVPAAHQLLPDGVQQQPELAAVLQQTIEELVAAVAARAQRQQATA